MSAAVCMLKLEHAEQTSPALLSVTWLWLTHIHFHQEQNGTMS